MKGDFFFYFLEEVMTMSGIEIAALSWFPIHFTGLVNHSGEWRLYSESRDDDRGC